MDRDEEEGLRAFALSVDARIDGSGRMRPLSVSRDGQRADVASVESEWVEAERIGFQLRLAGGEAMLLYYVPELDLWSGVWPGGARVRRRT